MNNRSHFDIPAANECNECKGVGYTYDTAQVGRMTPEGYQTTSLGYGCRECLGVGRLVEVNEK